MEFCAFLFKSFHKNPDSFAGSLNMTTGTVITAFYNIGNSDNNLILHFLDMLQFCLYLTFQLGIIICNQLEIFLLVRIIK